MGLDETGVAQQLGEHAGMLAAQRDQMLQLRGDVESIKQMLVSRDERRSTDIRAIVAEAIAAEHEATNRRLDELADAIATKHDEHADILTKVAMMKDLFEQSRSAIAAQSAQTKAQLDTVIARMESPQALAMAAYVQREMDTRAQERKDAADRAAAVQSWLARIDAGLTRLYPLLIGLFLWLVASKVNSTGALPNVWFWALMGALLALIVGWTLFRSVVAPPRDSGTLGGVPGTGQGGAP